MVSKQVGVLCRPGATRKKCDARQGSFAGSSPPASNNDAERHEADEEEETTRSFILRSERGEPHEGLTNADLAPPCLSAASCRLPM